MQYLKVKTKEEAGWLSLLIVGCLVLLSTFCLELPAWVAQYGWEFWGALK